MPQYYSGADPTLAFSQGLMAGYEFVDRIKARKREQELQNRQLQMQERGQQFNERMQTAHLNLAQTGQEFNQRMATNADNRANTAAAEQTDTFEYDKGLRPEKERRAKAEFDTNQSLRGVQIAGAQETLNNQRGLRHYAEAVARMNLESGPNQQAPVEPPAQSAGATTSSEKVTAPVAATPSAPVDLRAAQSKIDKAPNFIQRVANDLQDLSKETAIKSTKDYWRSVANPGKESFGRAGESAAVRRSPLSAFDKYIDERDKVDTADRTALDVTMRNALMDKGREVRDKIAALDAADPKNAAQLTALQNESATISKRQDALAKAAVVSATKDAGITQSVKLADPRIDQAISATVAAHANTIPAVSSDEMRALNTQLARMGNSRRLTPKQIETLAKARAYGAIDDQTLMNWRQYGGPLAPMKPEFKSMGAGGGVMIYPNGQMVVVEPQGENKGAAARLRNGITDLGHLAESAIKAGEIPGEEGGGLSYANKALTLIQANASEFQKKTGIRVINAQGQFDPSELLANPQNMRLALEMPLRAANNNRDSRESELPIDGAQNAAQTIPQTTPLAPGQDGVIDMTHLFN